ncbi:MAG: hypothetical protein KKA84_03160 [Bacteroidetes bacterium]|nr:hypothetical protein [Bacteroidota bacterium]
MKITCFVLLLTLITTLSAQQWQRKAEGVEVREALFNSTLAGQLPTSSTLKSGDIEYEISHRFVPAINEDDANFGFDGPVKMRMALSYGLSDYLMVTLGRSNVMDNYDLRFKYNLYHDSVAENPYEFAVQAGIATNSQTPDILDRSAFDGDNIQFYVQGIFNIMFAERKFGVGVVPSYLYNSMIFSIEKQYTFNVGTYAQYFFNRMFSLRVEYMPIVAGYQGYVEAGETGERSYNTLAFNLDIETGGHVFQIMATNNLRLNPSQYLVGANDSASSGDWHLGFGILRVF